MNLLIEVGKLVKESVQTWRPGLLVKAKKVEKIHNGDSVPAKIVTFLW